jgi:hypothetical protein
MLIDKYELTEHPREDGTLYLTCSALPGFHFILAPGEPANNVLPALREFDRLYQEAVKEAARRAEAGTPMPVPILPDPKPE